MLSEELDHLEQAAWDAFARAHAPYSGFCVGAALATDAHEPAVGCNLENASLGLGICAERVALFGALARGEGLGGQLVIVTHADQPTPPCGACREVLREFCEDLHIVSITGDGARRAWTLAELLPAPPKEPAQERVNPRLWIARKRAGEELATAEIQALIAGLLSGEVESYQMTAFMMATCWRGMTRRETRDLTSAMLASGARLDLTGIPGEKIDKHSTGGVGDKISLPLAPLAMAAGVRVPMISGRGLGHTGGTLDKLDSIPGYRTYLPIEALHALAADPGLFVAGQTGELVPADRIMYALRDVSATVESEPLIVSSILSKKLAAGLTGLVLDVKFGRGAFMPTYERAAKLAQALVAVAGDLGLKAVALLTRMDEPIGETVGNALEVEESLRFLTTPAAASDLHEVTLALGGLMTTLAGKTRTLAEGAALLEQKRLNGEAAAAARLWIQAQGGDPDIVDHPERLAISPLTRIVTAPTGGFIHEIDARRVGDLCVALGGGRRRASDPIDGTVGLRFHKKRGAWVKSGEALFTLYLPGGANPAEAVAGEDALIEIGATKPEARPIIAGLVTSAGIFEDPGDVPIR